MLKHLIILLCSLFMSSAMNAQTCEETAERQARVAYRDVYNRVLSDCRAGQPTQCRSNLDCAPTQECQAGRCISRPQACVKNCTARWNNGECRQYGSDYCGINPICVPRCHERFNSGDCQDYGPDACGAQPLSCVQNCTERFISGQCKSFGIDYCGVNPQCTLRCNARWPNGDCREYGADACAG